MPIEKGRSNALLATLRFLRPRKLDAYLLSEIIGPFAGGLLFFVFIFLMFQALRLAEFFIVHGVPGLTVLKMAFLMGISILPSALPVAFLIAVLSAFGRLSADGELVAIKAGGMSTLRMTLPLLVAAGVVSALSIALTMQWVPWGQTNFKRTLVKVGNTRVVSGIREGIFTSGFFDLLVFADRVDSKTNRLKRVFIYDEREPKNPLTVVARSGEIIPVKTQSDLGSAALMKLYNGSIHSLDPVSNSYQKVGFGEYRLYLKMDEGTASTVRKPEMIPHAELIQRIKKAPPGQFEHIELRGEFWRRWATALTPFFFVFMGIGFGTVRTRAVRAGAGMIGLSVLLLYWGVHAWATLQMQKGLIPPFFAQQLPNAIIGLLALFAFRRANW
ncbi:MAG: hypothetical protein A2X94_04305 [Bdellovibrionales bacterium GWB1_55_8]|nr:MAG: hypothetical protein A2X94_04305 [Bdellovibrionales bacterium GWB1_55_8]